MAVEIKSVSPVFFCNVYVYVFMCASVCVCVGTECKCQTGEGQETVAAREWHMNKGFTGKNEKYRTVICIYMSVQSHMRYFQLACLVNDIKSVS